MKGHYVYKYVNEYGLIVYIGKCDKYLKSRIDSHQKDPYSDKKIFFARMANSVEADIMESLLINKYKPIYNEQKKSLGVSISFEEPEWIDYSVYLSRVELVVMKTPEIGNALTDIRTIAGLTQADVAFALGVTTMAVSGWENGKRLPPYDKMLMLSDLLDVPVDELFYDKNKEARHDKHC